MISSYRIVYQSSDRQHAGSDPPACSSIDLNANPGLLGPYACMVIGGHDEYWTRAMREHTQRFVGNGGNLIVLSGNTAYRAVRLEDNNTRVVFHKYPSGDPNPKNEDATVAWADPPLCNPPNVLFGGGPMVHSARPTARHSTHCAFRRTGCSPAWRRRARPRPSCRTKPTQPPTSTSLRAIRASPARTARLESAISRQKWTESDRNAMREAFASTDDQTRMELLRKLAVAINHGELVMDGPRIPL